MLDDDAWNGPSPIPDLSLGDGVLTLWYDTYVHADDIRDAIGAPSDRGAGLGASVAYLARELTTRGWGPATLTLDDVPAQAVGTGGPTVTGDPLEFVLAATGRRDPGAARPRRNGEHLRHVAAGAANFSRAGTRRNRRGRAMIG